MRLAEKATNEVNETEQWQAIMEFSDLVSSADERGRTEVVQLLTKRLAHKNPNVVVQTATVIAPCSFLRFFRFLGAVSCGLQVINTCAQNCGRAFHVALCNRELMGEIKKIVSNVYWPPARASLLSCFSYLV